MSLTCHEENGRVESVGRGCYENASDLSATSRVCRAHGIWRTTRHTDKRAALHGSRPPADQSGKRVASWMGSRPTRPALSVLVTSYEDVASVRRVQPGATRMLREAAAVEFNKLY